MSRRRKQRAMTRWNRYAARCERLALAGGWGAESASGSRYGFGRGWGAGDAYMALHRKLIVAEHAAAYTHDHLTHRMMHRDLAHPAWSGVRCGRCKRLLVPHFLPVPPRHDEPGTPRQP